MWGYDHYGHLNNGSFTADTSSPNTTLTGGTNWVSIGTGQDHIAAIKTDGTLWSWGRGLEGEMGNNTNTQSNSSPLQEITGSTNWTQVSAGSYSTYAIKTDGTLWTWGYNNLGQLGNGTNGTSNNTNSPGTVAGGGTTWKYAVGGGYHAAALKTDGTLWTWGQGLYGALANGAPNNTASPGTVSGGGTTWSQLSCSTNHIAAIKTDGTLWTSGANNFGQLGDGTTTNRSSFATVAGGGTTWSQVSAGPALAAIKTDGTLWTCGYNNYGELGNGTTVSTSSLAQIASGINTWRSVYAGTYYIMAIAQ
jgi:alpha-tubulin suppressor-like RCC1 family protein